APRAARAHQRAAALGRPRVGLRRASTRRRAARSCTSHSTALATTYRRRRLADRVPERLMAPLTFRSRRRHPQRDLSCPRVPPPRARQVYRAITAEYCAVSKAGFLESGSTRPGGVIACLRGRGGKRLGGFR